MNAKDLPLGNDNAAGVPAGRLRWRRIGRLVLIGVLTVVLTAWGLGPVLFVYSSLHPARQTLVTNPQTLPFPVEPVAFRTADGLTLRGWLGRQAAPAPVILLGHGYGNTREQMIPHAVLLYAAGYSVLLFDWRGHGLSDGTSTSFGLHEVDDMRAALDYLAARPDLGHPQRFGALGVSLGAGIMLYAAAHDSRLAAVVCDSIYYYPAFQALFADMDRNGLGLGVRRIPVAPLAGLAANAMLEGRMDDLDPRLAAPRVSPRALLFIHSAEDHYQFTPLSGAQAIYDAAHAPKDLWIAPHGAHAATLAANPTQYPRRVRAFFAAYLGPGAQ